MAVKLNEIDGVPIKPRYMHLTFNQSCIIRSFMEGVLRMKKPRINVRHYWAKTVDGEYGGLGSQLAIELLVTFIFVSIMVYSFTTDGLGLFFAGFLIPTLAFITASMTTMYALITEYVDRKTY